MVEAPVSPVIYSIGHSNQPFERFVELLTRHQIVALVDTRSRPASRYAPQFNRPMLERMLPQHAIRYVFRGAELGGRPSGDAYYDEDGHVLYARVAEADFFVERIRWLERQVRAKERRIALLCSEENPEHCHRRLLIGRVLDERGIGMTHIRGDGTLVVERPGDFGRKAATVQLSLFDAPEDSEWRSTRSVLQRSPQPSSLEH